MRKNAFFITVLFALGVTLLSVSAVFFEFNKLNKHQYIEHIFSRHETITQIYKEHLQKKTSQIMLEANLAVYRFLIKEDKDERKIILKNAKLLKGKNFKRVDEAIMLNKKGFYTQKVIRDLRISMIEHFLELASSSVLGIISQAVLSRGVTVISYFYIIDDDFTVFYIIDYLDLIDLAEPGEEYPSIPALPLFTLKAFSCF